MHYRPRALALTGVLAASLALIACSGSGTPRVVAKAAPASSSTSSSTTVPPVAPLTGLPADPATASKPALSVKVDNTAAGMPQSGLNDADVVTEALVEGGLTRLLATFQSKGVNVVGPIRSARPVDADLLRQLGGGYFAYSGAAPDEIAPAKDHSNAVLICQ